MISTFSKFREWLAYKIFPEIDFYILLTQRVAEINENERCIALLKEKDSACGDWAEEIIKIKLFDFDDIHSKLKMLYEEEPF